jgi:hypothetical protein
MNRVKGQSGVCPEAAEKRDVEVSPPEGIESKPIVEARAVGLVALAPPGGIRSTTSKENGTFAWSSDSCFAELGICLRGCKKVLVVVVVEEVL